MPRKYNVKYEALSLQNLEIEKELNFIYSEENPIIIDYDVNTRNKSVADVLGGIVAGKVRKSFGFTEQVNGIFFAFAIRYSGKLQACYFNPTDNTIYYHLADYTVKIKDMTMEPKKGKGYQEEVVMTPLQFVEDIQRKIPLQVQGIAILVEKLPHQFHILQD